MKKFLTLLMVGLLSSAIISAQKKEEKEKIIGQIVDKGEKLRKFYIQGNIDSIANYYSPNCQYMAEFGGIVDGREKLIDELKKFYKPGIKITELKFEIVDQKVDDNMVFEIGKYEIKYMDATKVMKSEKYNYMRVWKKSKDEKYRIRQYMSNLPQNPSK